ncbi:hypothetical protein HDU98_000860, partial [Podochytrium sp. JEL0797]
PKRYLWTTVAKTLEIHEPNPPIDTSPASTIFRARLDVTGTAGNFLSLTGGGPEGGPVYSGHEDGKIIVWEASTYTKRYIVSTGIYKCVSLCLVEKSMLWCGFSTGKIAIYDTSAWDGWIVVKEFVGHKGLGGATVAGALAGAGCSVSSMVVDAKRVAESGELCVVSCAAEIGSIKVWDGFLMRDWKDKYLRDHATEFTTYRPLPIFLATWNINASKPDAMDALPSPPLTEWFTQFQHTTPPSLIVIGFQELVDLESRKANAKQILKEFTSATSTKPDAAKSDARLVVWRERITRGLADCLPQHHYRLLECHSLFGLFQCVYILSEEYPALLPGSVRASQVKTGMGGFHGNKGAIAIRLVIDDTSLCFVNVHLAAHQENVSARNNDLVNIREGVVFEGGVLEAEEGRVWVQGGDGSMILDHETVFLSGDLNYRINLPHAQVHNLVQTRDYSALLASDQLSLQFATNPTFALQTFREPPIHFAPTFKYDPGSTAYDSSEKKRIPSYCDRILHRSMHEVREVSYGRQESVMSDHRAVAGAFVVQVKKVERREVGRWRGKAEEEGRGWVGGRAGEWVRSRGVV